MSDVIVTTEQAIQRGLVMRSPPPSPLVCEYCGAALLHTGVAFGNMVVAWNPEPPRCDCPQAQEHWATVDAEKLAAEEQRRQQERQQELLELRTKLLVKSGIKERFLSKSFDNYTALTRDNQKALTLARRYVDNFGELSAKGMGLYLTGTCGVGKTHLATAIALELIAKGIPAICKTMQALLNDMSASITDPSDRSLEMYSSVDLLIIDDMGKEVVNDWSIAKTYALLNARYEACKPTIITSNYTPEELATRLAAKRADKKTGDSAISRISEMCYVVAINGTDQRAQMLNG